MSRLVFFFEKDLSPSQVILREELATGFDCHYSHDTKANGKSEGFFYTDCPQGSPHDDALITRVTQAVEDNENGRH